MPKCDFNKVSLQLYWNRTSARMFSCKFAAYFQSTFSKEHLWMAVSVFIVLTYPNTKLLLKSRKSYQLADLWQKVCSTNLFLKKLQLSKFNVNPALRKMSSGADTNRLNKQNKQCACKHFFLHMGCYFTYVFLQINTPPWVFSTFFKLYKWY